MMMKHEVLCGAGVSGGMHHPLFAARWLIRIDLVSWSLLFESKCTLT